MGFKIKIKILTLQLPILFTHGADAGIEPHYPLSTITGTGLTNQSFHFQFIIIDIDDEVQLEVLSLQCQCHHHSQLATSSASNPPICASSNPSSLPKPISPKPFLLLTFCTPKAFAYPPTFSSLSCAVAPTPSLTVRVSLFTFT